MVDSWTHESERYRFSTLDDLPAFEGMLADPEVGRWLWFTPLPPGATEGFFGPLIRGQAEALAAGEMPQTAVFTVETTQGEFLGQGAVVAVEMSPGGCEIGFQLSRNAWGRGVGTRLGQFLCAYAVERCAAYRIQGACLEGNTTSARLLAKLGLRLEGTRPGYRCKGAVRHTELCFGREVRELDRTAIRGVAEATGLASP